MNDWCETSTVNLIRQTNDLALRMRTFQSCDMHIAGSMVDQFEVSCSELTRRGVDITSTIIPLD